MAGNNGKHECAKRWISRKGLSENSAHRNADASLWTLWFEKYTYEFYTIFNVNMFMFMTQNILGVR